MDHLTVWLIETSNRIHNISASIKSHILIPKYVNLCSPKVSKNKYIIIGVFIYLRLFANKFDKTFHTWMNWYSAEHLDPNQMRRLAGLLPPIHRKRLRFSGSRISFAQFGFSTRHRTPLFRWCGRLQFYSSLSSFFIFFRTTSWMVFVAVWWS